MHRSASYVLRGALSFACAVLCACGGNYQAPVSEQGERQQIRAPIIVDSSTPESSFFLPASGAQLGADSAAFASRSPPGVRAATATSYRVRPGDSLFSIAYAHDMDFRSLAIANSLSPPYTIFVGQELNLDLSRVQATSSSPAGALGAPVNNNAVAQAQASLTRAGGLIRRAIDSVSETEPNWQWPHGGQLLRGFSTGSNKGVDLSGRVGDPVLAAGDGDVVYAGRGIQGNGNLIILRHNDRFLSAYAHNSRMLVTEGNSVRRGDKIAELGQSPQGVAMLHFEIRVDGESVDPLSLLPGR